MDHYAYLCAIVALAFSLQALWCQLVPFFVLLFQNHSVFWLAEMIHICEIYSLSPLHFNNLYIIILFQNTLSYFPQREKICIIISNLTSTSMGFENQKVLCSFVLFLPEDLLRNSIFPCSFSY